MVSQAVRSAKHYLFHTIPFPAPASRGYCQLYSIRELRAQITASSRRTSTGSARVGIDRSQSAACYRNGKRLRRAYGRSAQVSVAHSDSASMAAIVSSVTLASSSLAGEAGDRQARILQ